VKIEQNDLDKEFVMFMIKLFNQQQEQIRGEELHGYMQEFSLILLSVILFSEKQIKCLASDKLRYLHLDATGSIIAQPNLLSTATTIYYCALLLPGNIDVGPLPIAEFISSKHDITAIKHFLDVFNDRLKKITTKEIKKIETDFSLALIL